MARYPQGVKTFIPQIQPYQVDFNFANNVLKAKQNQYDTNWKQLNKLYGQIYYANLTREESKEKQQALVKQIDFNLKRISTMDLSLDQNVQAAKQIFQPFYEDKNLMKDIAWTKNTSMALSGAESLRNSSDDEQRSRYWQDGVNAINYRIDEFKETPYDQIQSVSNVRYTPYVDVMAKAEAIAKEFGDQVTPSFEDGDKWILNTTNGEQLRPHLQKLFQLRMANDPAIQDLYRTQAYVDRKNYMYQNAAQYNGDKNAAEVAYLEATYNLLKPAVIENNKKLEEQDASFTRMITRLNKRIADKNVTLNTYQLLDDANKNKTLNDGALILSRKDFENIKEGKSTLSTSTGPMNASDDISLLRTRVDSLRTNQLMRTDFLEAADVYAFRNFKQELEVNDYGMERVKAENRMRLEAYSQDRQDQRQKKVDNAADRREYQKHMVDTGQAEYYFDEEGNRQIKIFEELDEVASTSAPLVTGTFDVGKALLSGLTVQENKLSNDALAGFNFIADLGLEEEAQKSLFGGMTLGEAKEYVEKDITELKTYNPEKLITILQGIDEAINGNNSYSKKANEIYGTGTQTAEQFNAYKKRIAQTQIDIDAYGATVNHQVYINTETFKALEQQGGNALSGLLAVNEYGFKVDDSDYIEQVQTLANLSESELEDIRVEAMKPKREIEDDIRRGAAWASVKTNPNSQNVTLWAASVLADWMDASQLRDFRAVDLIPFRSLALKLNGDGAPTLDQAYDYYSKAYKVTAEKLGNPIMYRGKIGDGAGNGISSVMSTIQVHPLGVDSDNYSNFYEGIKGNVVPIEADLASAIDLVDQGQYLLTLNGTGLTAGLETEKAYDDSPTDADAVMNLINLVRDKSAMSELKADGKFKVHSTVSTAYDGNKSAYTIVPSMELIEKYAIKRNATTGAITKNGLWELDQGQKMESFKNGQEGGATIIADQGVFKSDIYNSSFQDRVTMNIDASPDKSYTVRDGRFTLNFKRNEMGDITLKTNMPIFNVENFVNNPTDYSNNFDMSQDVDPRFIKGVGDKSTDQMAKQFLEVHVPRIESINNAQARLALQLMGQANEDGSRKYTNEQIINEVNRQTAIMYGN